MRKVTAIPEIAVAVLDWVWVKGVIRGDEPFGTDRPAQAFR